MNMQPATAPAGLVLDEALLIAARFQGATRFPSPHLDLFEMPGFLDPAECDLLVRYIDDNRAPSEVAEGRSSARTSETCQFEVGAPVVRLLDLRLSLFLGIAPALGESIQGQRYAAGQEFKLHHDYFAPGDHEARSHVARCGNRTWTAMIYLNQPDEGGETFFPYLDHAFVPRQGTLLCWNNLALGGQANPHTLHEGRPVVRGTKYIVTKWFRERPWLPSPTSAAVAAPAPPASRRQRRAMKARR